MRTIIAGSRAITDPHLVTIAIHRAGFSISQVVSGGARGVDRLGERWAKANGIPVKKFPADWKKHGMGAGHVRNREMAHYADALIAIWDGASPGTKSMIDYAKRRGLRVYVLRT